MDFFISSPLCFTTRHRHLIVKSNVKKTQRCRALSWQTYYKRGFSVISKLPVFIFNALFSDAVSCYENRVFAGIDESIRIDPEMILAGGNLFQCQPLCPLQIPHALSSTETGPPWWESDTALSIWLTYSSQYTCTLKYGNSLLFALRSDKLIHLFTHIECHCAS